MFVYLDIKHRGVRFWSHHTDLRFTFKWSRLACESLHGAEGELSPSLFKKLFVVHPAEPSTLWPGKAFNQKFAHVRTVSVGLFKTQQRKEKKKSTEVIF